MTFTHFSHNGALRPLEQATISLSSVEYSYGFGVYETIRVTNGTAMFVNDHIGRLLESAKIISLEHPFMADSITMSLQDLIDKNKVETCNIKILLVGGATPANANLYMMCLNPLFPDRKLYRTGVSTITQRYERPFPHAKSLNMLPSYLAFREAKKVGAYDALLLNQQDELVEGTRTNLLALKDQTLISPPAHQILLGVMRDKVLQVATQAGYAITEEPILLAEAEAGKYDSLFLTSTSSKIMPIRSIDDHELGAPSSNLKILIRLLDELLKQQV